MSWRPRAIGNSVPDELSFWMGKFEARFPTDRRYARNHLWLATMDEGRRLYRVGLTAYSVRLLRDVYFLDWTIDPDTAVQPKQEIGEIESSKALSSLYAPAAGVVRSFNEQLLDDPTPINLDCYNSGWLFDLQSDSEFMSATDYLAHMEAGWDETQRTIKGQMNE